MRIIYVGQLSFGGTCLQRLRAIEELGHEVVAIDTSDYASSSPLSELWHRGWNKIHRPRDRAVVNARILRALDRNCDILWADKALTLWPETLDEVKCLQRETMIVGYSPDDMAGPHNQTHYFLAGLPKYDVYFTTKSYNVSELKSLGCPNVYFIAKSFDPNTHRPMKLSEDERRELGGPVGFIGGRENERAKSICRLAESGVPVKVYGDGWEGLRGRVAQLSVSGPSLYGDMYAKIICSFDIGLAFLRKLNRDLQTARSIEIPACGTFMLAERTDEHLELFVEGKEAEFFDTDEELLDKANFYMKHSHLRQRIATAGRKRCLSSGYSNHDRMRCMLERVLKMRDERFAAVHC